MKIQFQKTKGLNIRLLLAISLLFSHLSYAVPGQDGEFRGKYYDGIDSYDRNVDVKSLQVLGLTLSKSLLGEEQTKIGPSPIKESGSGPRDNAQICYEGKNGILLLEYKFQLDPDIRFLHVLILSKDKKAKELYTQCTPNSKITNDLTVVGGIRLGMSQPEMEKIWGKPSKIAPGILIYVIRRPTDEYFTDDVLIYTEFENDQLTYAEIARRSIH